MADLALETELQRPRTRGTGWSEGLAGPLLTAAAGWLDGLAFIAVGGLFASVMTGNIVLVGLHLASFEAEGSLGHLLVALGSYCGGVSLCTVLLGRRSQVSSSSPRLILAFFVEVVLLLGYGLIWVLGDGSAISVHTSVGLASAAMGLQGEAVRTIPRGLSTTYMTGTLTSVISGLARMQFDHDSMRAVSRLMALCAGAAAGALVWAGSEFAAVITPSILVALGSAMLMAGERRRL